MVSSAILQCCVWKRAMLRKLLHSQLPARRVSTACQFTLVALHAEDSSVSGAMEYDPYGASEAMELTSPASATLGSGEPAPASTSATQLGDSLNLGPSSFGTAGLGMGTMPITPGLTSARYRGPDRESHGVSNTSRTQQAESTTSAAAAALTGAQRAPTTSNAGGRQSANHLSTLASAVGSNSRERAGWEAQTVSGRKHEAISGASASAGSGSGLGSSLRSARPQPVVAQATASVLATGSTLAAVPATAAIAGSPGHISKDEDRLPAGIDSGGSGTINAALSKLASQAHELGQLQMRLNTSQLREC